MIADVPWVPSMGIHYLLAADGISRVLVLLTGLAAVAGVLFSWNIELRTKEFFAFYLRSSAESTGFSSASISFCFSSFTKSPLFPSIFLIAIWGSTRREYSSNEAGALLFFRRLGDGACWPPSDLHHCGQPFDSAN